MTAANSIELNVQISEDMPGGKAAKRSLAGSCAIALMLISPSLFAWQHCCAQAPQLRAEIAPSHSEQQAINSDSTKAIHISKVVNGSVTLQPQKLLALASLHGALVAVKNDSDTPLLFDGDLATAVRGAQRLKAASTQDVDNVVCPVKTPAQQVEHDAKAAIVAGGSLGLIPAIADAETQAGPILKRYGPDERRREEERSRFGKRMLWPGDTTSGVLYFKTAEPLDGFTFEIPINSLGD